MDTLFGIELERFSHPLDEEALKNHFDNFESYSHSNYNFPEYDSLYDRRIEELKFALFHRYNNTLQNLIVGRKMLDGLYRMIFIGELEKIKDYHKIRNSIDHLNRNGSNEDLFSYKRKIFRIYREQNSPIIDKLQELWNFTVKRFFNEFNTYEIENTDFFKALTNIKNLNGFEMKDFEYYNNKQISNMKSKFLSFLSNSEDVKLSLSEILLNNFKVKKDVSVLNLENIENSFSKEFYSNMKSLLINKLKLSEDVVSNKILADNTFMFSYNKDNFKSFFENIIKDKISEVLLKENDYFTFEVNDDIYILNKKVCKVPFIYIPGSDIGCETHLEINVKVFDKNNNEEDFSLSITKEINEQGIPLFIISNNEKSFDTKELILNDILYYLGINNFNTISKIKRCKIEIIFANVENPLSKGRVSFINLPKRNEEYIVTYSNLLEVIKKLNPAYKYKIEEITE